MWRLQLITLALMAQPHKGLYEPACLGEQWMTATVPTLSRGETSWLTCQRDCEDQC